MKKLLSLFLAGFLSLGLAACGNSNNQQEQAPKEDTQQATENKADDTEKIPQGLGEEMGNGDLSLSTPAGTSKENKAVLFVGNDTILEQIGLDAFEFDGSKLSYIYIDGNLVAKEQLGDTQTSLDLQGDTLKPGKHTVEVVQFDNDEPTGKAVTYKSATYEVKEK